jgi:hypothetical protein
VWSSGALVALLVVASACGPVPPTAPVLFSPHYGESISWPYPGVDRPTETVWVGFCSAAGGPVQVRVEFPEVTERTGLGVRVYVRRGGAEVALLSFYQPSGVPLVSEYVTTGPLRPGECARLEMGSAEDDRDPSLRFRYRLTW